MANQNGIVDEQWKTMYKQCKSIVEKEHKSMTRKKKKTMNNIYWTNQKYCSFYIFTQQVS